MFFSYESLIVTTRSHRQQKGTTPPCDRFRVFLTLRTPLEISTSEYSDFLNYLFKIIGHVDPSTKDLARFYFASPLDAEHWYSDSSRKFDWVPVYEQMKRESAKLKIEARIKTKSEPKKKYKNEAQNTLPEDTLFETSRGSMTFSALRDSLAVGDQVTCKCHAGYDHGGLGARHHSAFIKKADNGNVFYSCSGGRCQSVGTLWCEKWEG